MSAMISETSSSASSSSAPVVKIGDIAAQQPLSGVGMVVQTGAVSGRGGFVLTMQPDAKASSPAA